MNDHNHGKLWQGYLIVIFIFSIGVFTIYTGFLSDDFINRGFIFFVSALLIVASYIIHKEIRKDIFDCPICMKDKN